MKIIQMEENLQQILGMVDMEGSSYQVDLSLIEQPELGDYVIVHAGIAIEKLNREEADIRLKLFDNLAEIYRNELGQDVTLMAPLESKTES